MNNDGLESDGITPTLNYHAYQCTTDECLHSTVEEHFALENVGVKPTIELVSDEEKRAHRILKQTTIKIREKFHFLTAIRWRFYGLNASKKDLNAELNPAVKRICIGRLHTSNY